MCCLLRIVTFLLRLYWIMSIYSRHLYMEAWTTTLSSICACIILRCFGLDHLHFQFLIFCLHLAHQFFHFQFFFLQFIVHQLQLLSCSKTSCLSSQYFRGSHKFAKFVISWREVEPMLHLVFQTIFLNI